MSYVGRETSEYDGEPVELYRFMRGSEEWFFTTGAEPVVFAGDTYTPVIGLSRSNIQRPADTSKNQITVNMPRDEAIPAQFIAIPDIRPLWLYLYRIHDGEVEYSVNWQGRIRFVDFKGNTAVITLDAMATSTKKESFRHLFQGQCNHFTYDQNCGLDRFDFSKAITIASVADRVVTFNDTEIAGFYKAGEIVRVNGDRRFIVSDTVATGIHTVTLMTPFEGLNVGEAVTGVGGACLHDFATCKLVNKLGGTTEDNSENYGGYPKVPRKNPFRSFK